MKKFFNDNLHWFVIIALILAGFAVYKIAKANGGKLFTKEAETPAITE